MEVRNINFQKLMKVLSYREKFILIERANGMTLAGIAEILGISRERVRQVEEHALRTLRACVRLKDKGHLFNNNIATNNINVLDIGSGSGHWIDFWQYIWQFFMAFLLFLIVPMLIIKYYFKEEQKDAFEYANARSNYWTCRFACRDFGNNNSDSS